MDHFDSAIIGSGQPTPTRAVGLASQCRFAAAAVRNNSTGKQRMAIAFENTRFDPDFIEFHSITKRLARSVGYTADLSVDSQLAQLLRLRAAQVSLRL